ncbi:MAG: hypothetical protein E6G67_13725 [Actinobacteria bacterium]|nr:MAG: hypothetical protein E6G67_13725 [Actinomycetota bacterium]
MLEGATVRDIEQELNRLREASTDDQAPVQRTSVMTHVAWVPERWVGRAVETLAGLGERLPSRGILLFPEPDAEEDELGAEVDLRCFARGGHAGAVCFEVVQVHLRGERASHPGSVVEPLLLPDLVVFLRWRGPLPFGSTELEELVSVADRLIVDCAEWPSLEGGLAGLPELFDRVAVSDIAWARTEPWREAVAALWPEVRKASSLRVAGPKPEAVLLSSWLSTRLRRRIELVHEPAGEVELVEVDGRPAKPERLDSETSADLLSDQLEQFGRDRIFEEVVRSFSRAKS